MKKFLVAGLLIIVFLFLGCDENNGEGTGANGSSAVEGN